ncbi:hypothetical protein IG631_02829 [Alternaria alternata]|nr:hypothetical protein IG631_02829 [Alternaria alternata]
MADTRNYWASCETIRGSHRKCLSEACLIGSPASDCRGGGCSSRIGCAARVQGERIQHAGFGRAAAMCWFEMSCF